MSYTSIRIHCVWATKNRYPFLSTPEQRVAMFAHIREYAASAGLYIECVGGWKEHLHCIISMSPDDSISSIVHRLKGESSHWYNQEFSPSTRFRWQDDYFAVSISPDRIKIIQRYIRNQEEHHRHHSFEEEYQRFLLVKSM